MVVVAGYVFIFVMFVLPTPPEASCVYQPLRLTGAPVRLYSSTHSPCGMLLLSVPKLKIKSGSLASQFILAGLLQSGPSGRGKNSLITTGVAIVSAVIDICNRSSSLKPLVSNDGTPSIHAL